MGFGVEVPTGGVTNFCGWVEREALEHLAWQIADRHIEHIVIAKIGHDIGEDVRAKLAHGIERFVRRPIEFWRNAKKRLIIAFEGNSNDHLFFPYMNTGSRSSAIDRSTATGVSLSQKAARSEEHTSELQSLMRISYAVFCLKKKKK